MDTTYGLARHVPEPSTDSSNHRLSPTSEQKYQKRPWCLHYRSHTLFIVSTVALGTCIDLFLYGLLIPVLPYLLNDRFGIPLDQAQQHVSVSLAMYAGASVIFAPFAGYIADKTGSRQQPYLYSLSALLFATILIYCAQTELMLLAARVLQGMSAVSVWTIGFALCFETVGSSKTGATMGTILSLCNFATTAAPVVGGGMYQQFGSIGIFAVSVALIILDVIMRLLVIEKKFAHRYDSSIVDPMLSDRIQRHESAAGDEGTPLLVGELYNSEYRIPSELPKIFTQIPILYCLRNSRLWSSMLLSFAHALFVSCFDATVPTEAQSLFGFSSFEAGLLFVPLGFCSLITGPLSGWLVDKFGVKSGSILSYCSLIPPMISLRVIHSGDPTQKDGQDQVVLFASLLGLCGIGLGAIGTAPVVEAGAVVNMYYRTNPSLFQEQGPYGQLYGLNAMVYSAGLAVGPLLAGSLRDGIGYGNMNAILAGVCGVAVLLSYTLLGGVPAELKRQRHESTDND